MASCIDTISTIVLSTSILKQEKRESFAQDGGVEHLCVFISRDCHYIKGLSSKAIVHDQAEQTVRVDRTAWMDLALGRVRSQRITFPKDTSFSYKEHLKAPVRSYSKDDTGNPVAKYVTGENAADHSAHARVYAEVALPLACSLVRNQDINKVFT
jgi:hypothetical protein